MKALVKVLVAVLIANALFRIGSAYVSYYRFQDAVLDLAIHSTDKRTEQLRDKVQQLASTYDEPIDADAVAIRREEHHTFIDGKYKKPVALVPGYEYQWPFTLSVDGYVIAPTKLGDLTNPQ
jgi:hypothetical protein